MREFKWEIDIIMATLDSLDKKLNAVLTAIANIATGDNTAVLAAIASLQTDVDTNVEGIAPTPAPDAPPAPVSDAAPATSGS